MKAYERLIRYTAYPTASNEDCPSCPSTPEQTVFANDLCQELQDLGLHDAHVDKHGYVYATIPSNVQTSCPVLGFIAHMDVVREVPFENVCPRVIPNYDGTDVRLSSTLTITVDECPELKNYVGKTLVVTDGNTLLGADDKAGIAEIVTMAERMMNDPSLPHGEIKIAFTPDEEIGRGADLFDVKGFGADFAYTLDGGAFGEVEYETFHAVSCKVTVNGKSFHPGAAKNRMVNASEIAMEFHRMLPAFEKPEHTTGYEGFYHLTDMHGHVEQCQMHYILRDHDTQKIQNRCETVRRITDYLNNKYGHGTVETVLTESYRNMAEIIRNHMHLIDTAKEAVEELGGTPVCSPVRGGTDGSRLSFMGLPCPNLGTGSHLGHGRKEFTCAEEMERCVDLAIRIAAKYAEKE